MVEIQISVATRHLNCWPCGGSIEEGTEVFSDPDGRPYDPDHTCLEDTYNLPGISYTDILTWHADMMRRKAWDTCPADFCMVGCN